MKFPGWIWTNCQWWVLLTACGLWLGRFQTLASGCALGLPSIEVQVFHTRLGVEIWGPVRYALCWSLVLGVKSKVWGANEEVNIESCAKLEILCSRFGGWKLEVGGNDKGESWLVCRLDEGWLKLVDSGYASWYSNMSNTIDQSTSNISENGDVRLVIIKMWGWWCEGRLYNV